MFAEKSLNYILSFKRTIIYEAFYQKKIIRRLKYKEN